MIPSRRVLACAAWFSIIVGAEFALAQDGPRTRVDRKIAAFRVHGGGVAKAGAGRSVANDAAANPASIGCGPQCDFCWFGGPFENECDPNWEDDGDCDCGCQFADSSDCGSECSCSSACDWCWCNTSYEGACPSNWSDDGECDCGCQFVDADCGGPAPTGACCAPDNQCSVRTLTSCNSIPGAYYGNGTTCGSVNCAARCAADCEACWVGTPLEGDCDPDWEGDGFCDCGCQFKDPDCGPQGACCSPANGECDVTTGISCVSYLVGVFHGVGVDCSEVDCNRCDPGCAYCWRDTLAEHACLAEWEADGFCDCGCQFADPDCASDVCGNLVCEEDATSCEDDCKDLRAFAGFQNCFDPGVPEPPQCFSQVYGNPLGVGLEDYARFADFLSGP